MIASASSSSSLEMVSGGSRRTAFLPAVGTEESVDPTGCGNCSTATALIGYAEGLARGRQLPWQMSRRGSTRASMARGPFPRRRPAGRRSSKKRRFCAMLRPCKPGVETARAGPRKAGRAPCWKNSICCLLDVTISQQRRSKHVKEKCRSYHMRDAGADLAGRLQRRHKQCVGHRRRVEPCGIEVGGRVREYVVKRFVQGYLTKDEKPTASWPPASEI